MNNKEILDNAPSGATHKCNNGHYWKFILTDECRSWCVWGVNNLNEINHWYNVECPDFCYIRSLADIREMIQDKERIAELEAQNLGLTKTLVELEQELSNMSHLLDNYDFVNALNDKELEILKLEQQAKGLSEYKDALIKIASEMPLQLECRSKGSSCYNWAMYYAREISLEAQTLNEQAKQLGGAE